MNLNVVLGLDVLDNVLVMSICSEGDSPHMYICITVMQENQSDRQLTNYYFDRLNSIHASLQLVKVIGIITLWENRENSHGIV